MLTQAQLDDLKVRCRKGWVIRPDQIQALIGMAEAHLYRSAGGGGKAADPNAYPAHAPQPPSSPTPVPPAPPPSYPYNHPWSTGNP